MELNDYDIEREEYKILKISNKEIRELSVILANEIINNKKRMEELKEKNENVSILIDLEIKNNRCVNLLHILKYLER